MPSPCTVTATLQTVADAALQGNAYVRFILRNFAGFVPRVSGVSVITEFQLDVLPDGNGQISTTLWGNDNIDPSGTFYEVQWWNGGRITSRGNFNIIGTAFDLDTAAQINPPPPVPQTYLMPLLLETNGIENGSQIKLNVVAGSGIGVSDDGVGNVTVSSTTGGSVAGVAVASGAFIEGDSLVFSEVDSAWVKMFTSFDWEIQGAGSNTANINRIGPWQTNLGTTNTANPGTGGAASAVGNDSALPVATRYTTGAAGSPATNGFAFVPAQAVPFGQHRRVNIQCRLVQTTACRAFFGIQDAGNSISLNVDSPNINFIGFRYSASVDTNFMAYACTDNTHSTIVDTGIPADTNYHVFDIVYTGTTAKYYIDRALVATITTNLPAATTVPAHPAVSIDNKSTGSDKAIDFYRMRGSMPKQYK